MRNYKHFLHFTVSSFLLLSLVPMLGKLTGTSLDFYGLGKQASEATGVPWSSNLWDMVRLAMAEPGLSLLLLGSFVPTLAAIIVLVTMRNRRQWIVFFKRFNPSGGAPVSSAALNYSLLFGGLLLCLVVIGFIRKMVAPGAYEYQVFPFGPALLGAILSGAFLDQGAVLEEGGWRGFATPYLQNHGMGSLHAALLVGVVWSFWHLPRDFVSATIMEMGPARYFLIYLPAFTLGCLGVSVIATYFMNRMGGSILPAIVAHGLANDAMGISGKANLDQTITAMHQLTQALPICAMALVILYIAGPALGSKPN